MISIAAACYTIHYAKRLYETVFIHRFSHATMPMMNLFKNCAYYWGFTAYVAYHVCHPLYTPPSTLQTYIGLAGFAVIFEFPYSNHSNSFIFNNNFFYGEFCSFASWATCRRTLLCVTYGLPAPECAKSRCPIGIH